MLDRVGNRKSNPLRISEQDKPVQPRRLDHRLQIAEPQVERESRDVPVRGAVPARIITQHGMGAGQHAPNMTKTSPIMLHMREEGSSAHNWRSFADKPIRQPYPILRAAVTNWP